MSCAGKDRLGKHKKPCPHGQGSGHKNLRCKNNYSAAALTFLAKRDFLRAAVFLWSTPLDAALSIVLAALASRVVALSTLPVAAASAVLRTAVFTVDFTAKFEARLSASVFTLRMEDLICGKGFTSLCKGYTGYEENFSTMNRKMQGKSGVHSGIICRRQARHLTSRPKSI